MIYFIQSQDKIKIGVTDDPIRRIADLQTGNPHRLICKLLIDGSYADEAEFHRMFASDRRLGEWFVLSPAIKEYITERQHEDQSHKFFLSDAPFYCENAQIRSLRLSLGLTGAALADLMGTSRAQVCHFESRERHGNITFKTMRRVAEALGYDFNYRFIPKQ